MGSDVHIGLDGWLFLVGGSNELLDQYENDAAFDSSVVPAWVELLERRRHSIEAMGVRYQHLVAPNKLSVYPDMFDAAGTYEGRGVLSRLSDAIAAPTGDLVRPCFVDPVSRMRARRGDHDLYMHTDTHWNFHGCFAAYTLLCERLGAIPNWALPQRPSGTGSVLMDLGSKIDPPVREDAQFFDLLHDANRVYANSIVEFKERANRENDGRLHKGSNVVFRNDAAANDETLVLFGDSFAEYRPTLLTGMLAETFRELHFVWSAGLDLEYVRRVEPDIVVTQIVERFMPTVPTDNFDLAAYADEQLRDLAGTNDDGE